MLSQVGTNKAMHSPTDETSRWRRRLLGVYRGQIGAFARQLCLQFVERLLRVLAHDNVGSLGERGRGLGGLLLDAFDLALRFGAALRVEFGGGGCRAGFSSG